MTHICVDHLTIIGLDNGLSPSHYLNQCWNIVNWTFRNKLHEILIKVHTFSFKKMHLKMSSGRCWPFCPGLNELTVIGSLGMNFILSIHCLVHTKPSVWRGCLTDVRIPIISYDQVVLSVLCLYYWTSYNREGRGPLYWNVALIFFCICETVILCIMCNKQFVLQWAIWISGPPSAPSPGQPDQPVHQGATITTASACSQQPPTS